MTTEEDVAKLKEKLANVRENLEFKPKDCRGVHFILGKCYTYS